MRDENWILNRNRSEFQDIRLDDIGVQEVAESNKERLSSDIIDMERRRTRIFNEEATVIRNPVPRERVANYTQMKHPHAGVQSSKHR